MTMSVLMRFAGKRVSEARGIQDAWCDHYLTSDGNRMQWKSNQRDLNQNLWCRWITGSTWSTGHPERSQQRNKGGMNTKSFSALGQ